MKALKIVLWITAIGCLLSVYGVFMPVSTWQSIAEFFGVGEFPDSPLFEYMVRLMSATYVMIGFFFVALAKNPVKYGVMVPFSGLALGLLGLCCAVTGLVVKLPAIGFLGDSLSCIILGVLILILWQKACRTS